MTEPSFVSAAASHPQGQPDGFAPTPETVGFNAALHLQLEPPAFIKTLPASDLNAGESRNGDLVQFPVPVSSAVDHAPRSMVRAIGSGAELPFSGLAYSAPFRLLSEAGVAAFRSIIAENERYAGPLKSRGAKSLRGLGYRSQFVRDFNYCDEVLALFSQIAGTPLGPHHMGSNLSQVNFGEIGAARPVDQWHIDSVPYVMVLLLSDATDMVGGKLRVAMLGEPSDAIDKINAGELCAEDIDVVDYPGPGYCIFSKHMARQRDGSPYTRMHAAALGPVPWLLFLHPGCLCNHAISKYRPRCPSAGARPSSARQPHRTQRHSRRERA